jgi:hypothetical protein
VKKLGLIASLLAALALALPATAAAGQGGHKREAKRCKAAASKAGGNRRGKCVSKQAKMKRRAVRRAVKACREERAEDVVAFRAKYGDVVASRNAESRPRHAFDNCVDEKVEDAIAAFEDAVKECKSELRADPAAFAKKYGRNHNLRNALGKCVSSHVRAEEESEDAGESDGEPESEEGEEADDGEAGEDEPGHVPDDAPGYGPEDNPSTD